jgi:Protein of unknown function (DUF2867)
LSSDVIRRPTAHATPRRRHPEEILEQRTARPDDAGGYRGQMAVLVKPNGLLDSAYMAAIKPFRHLLVYPAAMRQIERTWHSRCASAEATDHGGRRERVARSSDPPSR